MGGWWKIRSSDLGPAEWPADMEVSATPTAPRAWSKITNLVASNSHYLGGTPSVVIDGVLYYAGDDYTLGVTRPPINSWNGTLAAEVVRIPLAGSTVPIAILSMVAHSGIIYLSTLDSGTTSTTWAGRVFKFNPETQSLVTFGSDSFTAGKIPYSLAVLGGKLWVGTHRQDPSLYGEIWSIDLSTQTTTRENRMSDGIIDPPTLSTVVHTRASSTYVYRIIASNNDGVYSEAVARTCTNDPVLSGSSYNPIVLYSYSHVNSDLQNYKIYRHSGGATTGLIAGPTAYTDSTVAVNDTGLAGDSASSPALLDSSYRYATSVTATNIAGSGSTVYRYRVAVKIGSGSWAPVPSNSYGNTTNAATLNATTNYNYISCLVYSAAVETVYVRFYRMEGHTSIGMIYENSANNLGGSPTNFVFAHYDQGSVGDGTIPVIYPYVDGGDSSGYPPIRASETDTYKITARTASGATTESNAVSVSAKTTLDASNYNTITWGAVSGATSYDVYRTVGLAPLGKITNTASTSFVDDGDAGDASSPPTENGSGTNKGGVTSLMPLDTSLLIGLANTSGTFAEVWKRSAAGVYATSTTATGGTATTYNGFTAMGTFGTSLYAAYWNQDTTKICKIYKYDGSTWSTVLTIDGGDIVPILRFHTEEGVLMAIGGGRQQYGILYRTTDGTTWEDCTGLMPSAVEGLPVVGSIRIPV